MENRPRHYLDHAATSWPKPPGSLEACIEYQTNNGSAAGRGVYQSAERSNELIRSARQNLAKLIHASSPKNIGLCSSGTHALNAAILGLLQSPSMRQSHVLTTAIEHNSVLRPLELARKSFGNSWDAVPCDSQGFVDPDLLEKCIRSDTKLIVLSHASNVTGAIQNVEAISEIAKKHGCVFMVDAAQTLGYVPIDIQKMGIDILASPGHKGAGGMLGTGILCVEERVAPFLEPVWIGGTGSESDSLEGPFGWSAALESGNANLPAIASLDAGVRWLLQNEPTAPFELWAERLVEAICQTPSLSLIGPVDCGSARRVPVVSFVSTAMSCHEMAMMLDTACGVEARSGLHCAAMVHEFVGTKGVGGSLRLSLGHTTLEGDIAAAVEGIEMLGSMVETGQPKQPLKSA